MSHPKPQRSRRPYPFPTPKAAGEWIEMTFMVKATALGLAVSKPYGDQAYDLLVARRDRPARRVQVKSAFVNSQGAYQVVLARRRHMHGPEEVDFLVVYIPPVDAWYIIPWRALRQTSVRFYPHRPTRGGSGRWENYRDRWRLLTGNPADDTRSLGFTIHAQAEERQ